jgi:hypothetical protein
MTTYFFQPEKMASSSVASYLQSVKYTLAATPTAVNNGSIVTIGDPCTNIWGNSDLNCYQCATPSLDTDPIHIIDLLEAPSLTDSNSGRVYRVGEEIVSLSAPADYPVRARKPKLGDRFLLGSDGFASAPTVGQYAIPTAGTTTLTPSASIVTTKFCVKILASVTKSYGVQGSFTAYRCQVVTEK